MSFICQILREDSIQEFLNSTSELLYEHEATNTLMLGLCEGMLSSSPKTPPLLIRIVENHETVSAAIQTPPMNLVLTHASTSNLEELAKYLKKAGANFPGVVGPAKESEQFSKIWSSLVGNQALLGMGQKIYKLEKVNFPNNVIGTFRAATTSELNTVFNWIMAFAKESLPASDQRREAHWREFAERAVQKQNAYFWIHDNKPVSIAFASRPTKNGASINGVYTPPDFRKKGYASGVVAHISQKMLDNGKKFCVLYTDLSNPTSNKIYQNIGYKEVADSKHFLFLTESP
ncbi:MAG: GNAT family N-acetyltransferase [Pseudobdellovibrionaceae bacterium]